MKNKKIVILVCIIIAILVVVGVVLVGIKGNFRDDSNYISRQEWIGMLGEHTGASDFKEASPYFEDIDESNEYFTYIQSSVEWEYIEATTKFNGEKNATGEFVAITAMKSIGAPKIQLYLGTDDELEDKDYLNLALDLSLIEKDKLKKGLTNEEAIEIIEKLDSLYYGEFWPRDLEQVDYQDNVKVISSEDVVEYNRDENTLITSESLQAGDIITFKDGEFVVARKVINLRDDRSYELAFPEMEEVYKTLKQSGVTELTFKDIVNYYGADNLTVANAYDDTMPTAVMVSHTIGGEVTTKGFKIEAAENNKKLEIYVTDNDTGIRYKLPISPKISDDFENFSADIDVNKIFIGSQIDYSAFSGVKYADVAIDIETNIEAGLAAEDEISDRIILFETPTPLGTGVVGVDIQIYLVTTLSGEVYLKADIPFQADVYYEAGKGVRKVQHELSIENPEVKASAEMKKKIEFAPILVVGEFAPIIDAEVGAGILNKVEVEVHDNKQICTDAGIEFPVIDISVGQSDVLYYGKRTAVATLGWSASWDNIFEGKSFYKTYSIHFEILPNGKKQFVDECTYGKEPEDTLLNFDFSDYAGTYRATDWTNDGYGGGQKLDDLHLSDEGIITGGESYFSPEPYPAKKPLSVELAEDGSYKCVVNEEEQYSGDIFYIYPEGVCEDRFKDDEKLVKGVYIRYVHLDGGVSDKVFYKVDESESLVGMNTYTTRDTSMPEFSIDYPNNWSIKSEEVQSNYEWDVLQNARGVEISYYSSDYGFGSQYYGGNKVMDYVHITKVCDADFTPVDFNGQSYSSLGKYVVAKLKVYACEDGMSEDGEVQYDGSTYYAVIPESYLGDDGFCGTGYWAICASEYVKPMVVLAESPHGTFTADEESEVIQILKSFRIN